MDWAGQGRGIVEGIVVMLWSMGGGVHDRPR